MEDNENNDVVLCNESNPVWMCKHAMDVRHICKYLLCGGCFGKKLVEESNQGKNKRTRNAVEKKKDYDDNEIGCDHTSLTELQVYNCNGYFSESYIKKKSEEENCHYPTNCAECHKPVRDKCVSKKFVTV